MRKKGVGGGRARLSNLPPQPSAMAFTYLGQPTDSEARLNCSGGDIGVNEVNSDGQASTVPETSCDSDRDRRFHELAPNTTGETVVLAENSCGLGPRVHGLDDCVEIDWTEKEVCIKCDKGGKLLVCSDNNCPLAVHEECMLCSARFDGGGNFYCPYCSYKRAMLETRKARKKAMLAKKALSGFLDKGMVDGDPQKLKAEKVRSKEPNPSTVVGVAKHDETMNRLDGDEADNHFVQMEEDQHEERFDFCKGTKASAVTERNDVLSRCGDNVRPDDSGAHKIVIKQHTHPRPIIACGGSDSACCREEETGHQFEIVQIDRSVQPRHPNLVDDHQNERELQDEQQPGPLTASPVEKERKIDDAIHISTTGGLGNADVVKEHEGSRPEEEAMQDQEQEPILSSSGGDSVQQEYVKDSDLSHDDNEDVSPRWRRIKKNQNAVLPPSVYSPGSRRSARKLSEPNINVAHKKKKNATTESRQQLKSPSFPLARRKKLPWTTEEEEMLKEGVQKFSTMVNKNLPWRKILEFGHHVFHGTRTPADLKDKWRNILVKECSTR